MGVPGWGISSLREVAEGPEGAEIGPQRHSDLLPDRHGPKNHHRDPRRTRCPLPQD